MIEFIGKKSPNKFVNFILENLLTTKRDMVVLSCLWGMINLYKFFHNFTLKHIKVNL